MTKKKWIIIAVCALVLVALCVTVAMLAKMEPPDTRDWGDRELLFNVEESQVAQVAVENQNGTFTLNQSNGSYQLAERTDLPLSAGKSSSLIGWGSQVWGLSLIHI